MRIVISSKENAIYMVMVGILTSGVEVRKGEHKGDTVYAMDVSEVMFSEVSGGSRVLSVRSLDDRIYSIPMSEGDSFFVVEKNNGGKKNGKSESNR